MIYDSWFRFHDFRGQVMILTILALGGTILAGTTVAGLLIVYQVRQTTDFANSSKAIFAADTGIEWGLYQFFKGASQPPSFSNRASVRVVCADNNGEVPCTDQNMRTIRSVGKAGNVSRAFEQSF